MFYQERYEKFGRERTQRMRHVLGYQFEKHNFYKVLLTVVKYVWLGLMVRLVTEIVHVTVVGQIPSSMEVKNKMSRISSTFLFSYLLGNVYAIILSGKKKDIKLNIQYDINYIYLICAEIWLEGNMSKCKQWYLWVIAS